MRDEKNLLPADELVIVELDDRYEFSAAPVVNDACYNSNDCIGSTNSLCENAGACFA
jgi:hypothetical protein